uniref:C-type lectin domain-containing protein n=1 Tax=Rhabditophanes sp. KR3021 TaxID=114890 RepID=A0AC35TLI3_9BILA
MNIFKKFINLLAPKKSDTWSELECIDAGDYSFETTEDTEFLSVSEKTDVPLQFCKEDEYFDDEYLDQFEYMGIDEYNLTLDSLNLTKELMFNLSMETPNAANNNANISNCPQYLNWSSNSGARFGSLMKGNSNYQTAFGCDEL